MRYLAFSYQPVSSVFWVTKHKIKAKIIFSPRLKIFFITIFTSKITYLSFILAFRQVPTLLAKFDAFIGFLSLVTLSAVSWFLTNSAFNELDTSLF